jgi:hypothetical protein
LLALLQVPDLDMPLRVALYAFAGALPPCVLGGFLQDSTRQFSWREYGAIALVLIANAAAVVGVGAILWHFDWRATAVFAGSTVLFVVIVGHLIVAELRHTQAGGPSHI